MFLILFGLPGTGKTYIGNICKEEFGFCFYDADEDLPRRMREKILNAETINDQLRDAFFNAILIKIKKLKKNHPKLVLAQTFIKEKYRKLVLQNFKDAKFVLVKTETILREKRLAQRLDFPIDKEYAAAMCLLFDQPEIKYFVVTNNTKGKMGVVKQLRTFLSEHSLQSKNQ